MLMIHCCDCIEMFYFYNHVLTQDACARVLLDM